MPSSAHEKFTRLLDRSMLLSKQAAKLRMKHDAQSKLVFLHAGLAAQVASWDVYIKALAQEYFLATSNSTDIRFSAMHMLVKNRADEASKKLNTPNAENAREFLMTYTGYDIWSSWTGIRFGGSVLASSYFVRERLNEVFRVRHSFAHGIAMPSFSWNQNTAGSAHLTCSTLSDIEIFFKWLGRKSDAGMASHIAAQHGIARPW